MTPEQKRRRIQEIEKDVHQIMMQLHHIEYKVDSNLVRRSELPQIPKIKVPSTLKKLWIGFLTEIKTQKNTPN